MAGGQVESIALPGAHMEVESSLEEVESIH